MTRRLGLPGSIALGCAWLLTLLLLAAGAMGGRVGSDHLPVVVDLSVDQSATSPAGG